MEYKADIQQLYQRVFQVSYTVPALTSFNPRLVNSSQPIPSLPVCPPFCLIEVRDSPPGLDYNSVGPEHSHLHHTGRAEYIVADDFECLKAFKMVTELEGIIPALESSHGLWGGMQLAKTLPKEQDIVM